jgi:hypothetical protein
MTQLHPSDREALRRAGFTEREINTQQRKFYNLTQISPCYTDELRQFQQLMEDRRALLDALQCFRAAHNMPRYGDYSGFTWANSHMRVEGDPSWGWICERHGLGYQSGCICCRDDFVRHQERQDQNARFSRDDALRDADKKACAAIEKATGEQK